MASKIKNRKAQSIQERRQIRMLQELKKAKEIEAEDLGDDDEDEILDDEELVEEDVVDEEIPEEEDPAAESLKKQLETIEKDGMGDMGDMPVPAGPVSFDELDAAQAAQEQAMEVQHTSYQVQSLVYNILNHPMMDATEKSSAIQKVGSDFEQRISDILSAPAEDVQKDLDAMEAESVLAYDKRHENIASQLFDKAVLSTASRKKLSADQFALPSKRKYPIHDKAHVRNALARAAQQMKAGGEGAADARAAMPKIRAAAKRMGIGMSMKKEGNAILIEKDAQGDWRWVGWVSNNFQDRSGDIITEAAHLEFVDWVNKDLPNRAPVFTSCHAPGTVREHPVDFVGYENGFLVMSGKLTELEAEALMTVSKETDIGMSHTGWGLRDANDVHQITKYRSFEVTDLPRDRADNPFTVVETFSKEDNMDQLDYLSKLLGSKAKAEAALKLKTSLAQKELKEAGVESKEAKPPIAETQTQAPAPDDAAVKALVERLSKEFDIPGLNEFVAQAKEAMEKVPLLEKALTQYAASEDERLAEKIAPKPLFAWSRASESETNIVKEDDPLKKQIPNPGENWLSVATKTQPVAVPK